MRLSIYQEMGRFHKKTIVNNDSWQRFDILSW
jgi:hypothetical protein